MAPTFVAKSDSDSHEMKHHGSAGALTGAILLYHAIDILCFHGVHDKVRDPRHGVAIAMHSDSGDI